MRSNLTIKGVLKKYLKGFIIEDAGGYLLFLLYKKRGFIILFFFKQLIDNSIIVKACNRFRSTRVSLLAFQAQRTLSCFA